MRPLNKTSPTTSNSNYQRKFLNDLESVTDTELYFKLDYVLQEPFANRDISRLDYLLDFFQAGTTIPIPNGEKNDHVPGNNYLVATLASKNLLINTEVTLNSKVLLIEKHQGNRAYYCRLLIKWSDVVNLLLLDEGVTRWKKEPKLNPSLPKKIAKWDGLKRYLIEPLKDKVSIFYKNAKEDLIRTYGLYCAYCDTIITDGGLLDIEHKLPKSLFPDLQADWNNFVISCKVCNSSHKQTTPNLLFGRQRILYGKVDNADITNWTFKFRVSLVPQKTLASFMRSLEGLTDSLNDLTYVYFPEHNMLQIIGNFSADDKTILRNCFKSRKFEQLIDSIGVGIVAIDADFLPVPQEIDDFINTNSSKYSYDEKNGILTIKGSFTNDDSEEWAKLFEKVEDKETIESFEKLSKTINSLKKLDNSNDFSLLDSGRLIVIKQSGEELDFSYENIKKQAKEWNLWPDDGRNTLFSIQYNCTGTVVNTNKDPSADKWWVDKIADYDNYVVLQQKDKNLERLVVAAKFVSANSPTDLKLDFGTESIMNIVGLNTTKNDLVDGRILNRTKTWMIAQRQFNLLSTEIAQRTARQRLHAYFNLPANQPKNPFTDNDATNKKIWQDNWDALKDTLDDRSTVMESLLWNNMIEMAYSSGFFSVWINVFKTLDTTEGKPTALKFVEKLNERILDSSFDPHFYRSTNTTFVNDYIIG
ncbi:HNH endonuclease [Chitinophaga sancti]|uniref:HNH endonuclease n=1 Tax=Chitinophaga sancti TaxID=1004 RepID=UPI003F790B5E